MYYETSLKTRGADAASMILPFLPSHVYCCVLLSILVGCYQSGCQPYDGGSGPSGQSAVLCGTVYYDSIGVDVLTMVLPFPR